MFYNIINKVTELGRKGQTPTNKQQEREKEKDVKEKGYPVIWWFHKNTQKEQNDKLGFRRVISTSGKPKE